MRLVRPETVSECLIGPPLKKVPTLDDDEFSKLRLLDASKYTVPDRSPVSTVTVEEIEVSELSIEESDARGNSPMVVNVSVLDVALPNLLVDVTRA